MNTIAVDTAFMLCILCGLAGAGAVWLVYTTINAAIRLEDDEIKLVSDLRTKKKAIKRAVEEAEKMRKQKEKEILQESEEIKSNLKGFR